eukprot:1253794-Lingulodinium_polyedra.AAC.1
MHGPAGRRCGPQIPAIPDEVINWIARDDGRLWVPSNAEAEALAIEGGQLAAQLEAAHLVGQPTGIKR